MGDSANNQEMDIIDAYIQRRKHFILFLSGLDVIGVQAVGKQMARDFQLAFIDQMDFRKEGYNEQTTLPNGEKVVNWDTDEAIDWEAFNDAIKPHEEGGRAIVVGMALPKDKMTAHSSLHLHLALSKQKAMQRRREYVREHAEEHAEEVAQIDTPTESLKMNKLTFPYYLNIKERSMINKFVNVNDASEMEAYEKVFDLVVDFVEDFLYSERPEDKTRNQSSEALSSELSALSQSNSETEQTNQSETPDSRSTTHTSESEAVTSRISERNPWAKSNSSKPWNKHHNKHHNKHQNRSHHRRRGRDHASQHSSRHQLGSKEDLISTDTSRMSSSRHPSSFNSSSIIPLTTPSSVSLKQSDLETETIQLDSRELTPELSSHDLETETIVLDSQESMSGGFSFSSAVLDQSPSVSSISPFSELKGGTSEMSAGGMTMVELDLDLETETEAITTVAPISDLWESQLEARESSELSETSTMSVTPHTEGLETGKHNLYPKESWGYGE